MVMTSGVPQDKRLMPREWLESHKRASRHPVSPGQPEAKPKLREAATVTRDGSMYLLLEMIIWQQRTKMASILAAQVNQVDKRRNGRVGDRLGRSDRPVRTVLRVL